MKMADFAIDFLLTGGTRGDKVSYGGWENAPLPPLVPPLVMSKWHTFAKSNQIVQVAKNFACTGK